MMAFLACPLMSLKHHLLLPQFNKARLKLLLVVFVPIALCLPLLWMLIPIRRTVNFPPLLKIFVADKNSSVS